jgi:predicted aspartyl protease
MKLTKVLSILLTVTAMVWAAQALYFVQQNGGTASRISSQAERERLSIEIENKQRLIELEREYEQKKLLATGDSVFDRIFNTQEQTLIELVQRISLEAFPEGWSSDVRAEEFTHLILLVYIPHDAQEPQLEEVITYLQPIIKYCADYMSDIAVFDSRHKSYLFFDQSLLARLKSGKPLTKKMIDQAAKQGMSFTRFNSVTVECEKYESHLLVPIEVIGSDGAVTLNALLDTGASMTMLPSGIVTETGGDNMQITTRRTFDTANGTISCPVVRREVNIAGIQRNIEVAVNQQDALALVGMNFFDGMDYIVDFSRSQLYIWEK